jgi:hypothetical protein
MRDDPAADDRARAPPVTALDADVYARNFT